MMTCPKVPHTRDGYLHAEDDDTPYAVDGLLYCGRCHGSVNAITRKCETATPAPRPELTEGECERIARKANSDLGYSPAAGIIDTERECVRAGYAYAQRVRETERGEPVCDQCWQPMGAAVDTDKDHKSRHTIRGCIRALAWALAEHTEVPRG